jgi:hypothetical protein
MIHELKSFYVLDKMPDHEQINAEFLGNIKDYTTKSLNDEGCSITRVDWDAAKNVNRLWVKSFLPRLQSKLNEIMQSLKYDHAVIHEVWFQQYQQNDIHNWHIHGHNFTGVYYVECEDAPKTELISPLDHSLITPEVSVGSLLVFPSFCVHRAPKVKTDIRKTIISFNFDAIGVNYEL